MFQIHTFSPTNSIHWPRTTGPLIDSHLISPLTANMKKESPHIDASFILSFIYYISKVPHVSCLGLGVPLRAAAWVQHLSIGLPFGRSPACIVLLCHNISQRWKTARVNQSSYPFLYLCLSIACPLFWLSSLISTCSHLSLSEWEAEWPLIKEKLFSFSAPE